MHEQGVTRLTLILLVTTQESTSHICLIPQRTCQVKLRTPRNYLYSLNQPSKHSM